MHSPPFGWITYALVSPWKERTSIKPLFVGSTDGDQCVALAEGLVNLLPATICTSGYLGREPTERRITNGVAYSL
jgi:hypothetical protein